MFALQRHLSSRSSQFDLRAWDPIAPTLPPEQHASGDVEQALWEATNRPARPDGWASMPSPPWPGPLAEPRKEPLGLNRFSAPTGYPRPLQPSFQEVNNVMGYPPRPQPRQHRVEIRAPFATHDPQPRQQKPNNMPAGPYTPQPDEQKLNIVLAQPYPLQPEEQELYDLSMPPGIGNTPPKPPFKNTGLFVLPDVPPGLDSVDQLATHIPIA